MFQSTKVAQKLNGESWAITTHNRRLGYLTTFFTWLVSKRVPRRMPLEEGEILAFLEAIRNNTYCHPSSAVKHSYYYPFLAFIFYTGVRNAEAIGLRVRHVDFDRQ
jgi:integrase